MDLTVGEDPVEIIEKIGMGNLLRSLFYLLVRSVHVSRPFDRRTLAEKGDSLLSNLSHIDGTARQIPQRLLETFHLTLLLK